MEVNQSQPLRSFSAPRARAVSCEGNGRIRAAAFAESRRQGNAQWFLSALLLLFGLVLAGCTESDTRRRAEQMRRHMPSATQLSLDEVIQTFNHLHDFVNLELEPPVAVLDNRRTLDRQEALATFGRNPATPDAPYSNYLTIVSRNAPLKQLEVKPGDQVQYFVRLDEDRDIFVEDIGMADFQAVPMTVAQVVDDRHIIVEGRWPPIETEDAYKIEIWRNVDDRIQDIHERLAAYAEYGDPPLAWQPAPDEVAVEQGLNRLNQWMRHNYAAEAVQPPALLDTLPKAVRESPRLRPYLSAEAFGRVTFGDEEGRLLQQAVWLRDISNWARGEQVGDIDLARALFDWTVRHIQLAEANSKETAHHLARQPWEILLYGTGTAEQRAWIFVNLCRQQGLRAVVLGIPADSADSPPQLWCAAVVRDGELYLFDPKLGLPIPAPGGDGVATLSEAASDPEVLRRLDLGEEHPYRWSHEDVQDVVAMVVASPLSLSRRAALVQAQLVGQSGFVVSADPGPVAEMLDAHEDVQRVVLWSWPFQVLDHELRMALRRGEASAEHRRQRIRAALDFRVFALEPHLWKARVLHFRGPATSSELRRARADGSEAVDGHRQAIAFYQSARAADRELAAEQSDEKRQTMSRAKEDATYRLGLLKMDQGDHQIALSSWLPQVIDAEPASPWLAGARYNLARAHEALGQVEQAIALYEKGDSPQQHGNLLRARWLQEGKPLTPVPKNP